MGPPNSIYNDILWAHLVDSLSQHRLGLSLSRWLLFPKVYQGPPFGGFQTVPFSKWQATHKPVNGNIYIYILNMFLNVSIANWVTTNFVRTL